MCSQKLQVNVYCGFINNGQKLDATYYVKQKQKQSKTNLKRV